MTYIEIEPQESSGQIASFEMASIKAVILLLIVSLFDVALIVYGSFVFSLLVCFFFEGLGCCFLFFVLLLF